MTEISFRLEKDSINQAIEELKDYKDGLKSKCQLLCNALAEEGLEIARRDVSSSPLGNTITLQSQIKQTNTGCQAILIATGKTTQSKNYPPFNTLLAVEFGAGIHYNKNSENPHSSEFGMGVGTFPGQTHAFDDGGWYYFGDDNKWHHSSGVKATMPMYHAAEEMKNKISECAKKVFSSD